LHECARHQNEVAPCKPTGRDGGSRNKDNIHTKTHGKVTFYFHMRPKNEEKQNEICLLKLWEKNVGGINDTA